MPEYAEKQRVDSDHVYGAKGRCPANTAPKVVSLTDSIGMINMINRKS